MRLAIYSFFFLLLFLFACKSHDTKCLITRNELLRLQDHRVFETNRTDGIPDEFRDKGKDTTQGGYYMFYKSGNLKTYYFLKEKGISIYTLEYDDNGKLKDEIGNPVILKSADLNNDSLIIKIYFFTLNKKYRRINWVSDKTKSISLSLSKDTLFSNVETAKYVVHGLHEEQYINAYIEVEYENECIGQIKKFRDSINLHYKPNL